MAQRPLVFPTFAAELLAARDRLTVAQEVGLALRAHRRSLGTSQRAYARRRGWSKGHMSRLESSAGTVRLQEVVTALEGTDFVLAVCRRAAPGDPGGTTAPVPVAAQEWPRSELVARTRVGGRRFPAHHDAQQVTYPPSWWWASESTTAGTVPPSWTAPRPSPWDRDPRVAADDESGATA